MNRVGIMIDVSHPVEGIDDAGGCALEGADHRVAFGRPRARDVSRNMDDEQLLALKKNGGVVQIVAFNSYVKTRLAGVAERAAALEALRKEFGLPPGTPLGGAAVDARRRRRGAGGCRRGGDRRLRPQDARRRCTGATERREARRAADEARRARREVPAAAARQRSRTSSTTSTTP